MKTLKLRQRVSDRQPVVTLPSTLPVGVYKVQLVVTGHSGQSAPATLVIKVVKN